MGLDPALISEKKPRFEKIKKDHHLFYKNATAKTSKIEFTKCYYLPDHTDYSSIMVVSKAAHTRSILLLNI